MNAVAWGEIAAFFVLVAVCSTWEWLRPGWRVERFAELRRDVLSFAVAVLSALASREVVVMLVGRSAPASASLEVLRGLPFIAKLVLGLLAVDFCIYWVHRAQHRFAFGWRTHRWHHSTEQMYWLAGFRASVAHSFVYNVPQTIVPLHVLDLSAFEAGIGYAIGLFVQFWDHANARARIGILKYLFVRPQDHRLHHAAGADRVANFGFVFSFWDRCFGTYADGDLAEDYAIGLGEGIAPQSVPRMMLGV